MGEAWGGECRSGIDAASCMKLSKIFLKKPRISLCLTTNCSLTGFIAFFKYSELVCIHLHTQSQTREWQGRSCEMSPGLLEVICLCIYFNSRDKLLSFLLDNLLGEYHLLLTLLVSV